MASKSLCGVSNAMYSGNLTGDSRASSLTCFQPWLRPSRTDDTEVPATRRVELEEESEPRFNRPALYRVPAALVMSTTCGMLQLAAQALESPSPGEVLAQVNETLFARIPSNMFVTCFYAVLDPISASLRYSNAGHDLPYLHSGRGEAEELRARGMPLGLMPGMGYEQKEIELDVGEGVFFYSDGLVEAHDPKTSDVQWI